jgi:riboflavin synthase
MFTGLIINVGRLTTIEHSKNGARVRVESKLDPRAVVEGASIAVNGVCLTVKEPCEGNFEADLSLETLRRTTFTRLGAGAMVNLEPALKLGDSMGGHMVQGHVDGLGELVAIEPAGEFRELTWRINSAQMAEVVEKGSIAIDGISLTVARCGEDTVTAAIVPHTDEHTNLQFTRVGEAVNIETDIVGKYVRRTLMLSKTDK